MSNEYGTMSDKSEAPSHRTGRLLLVVFTVVVFIVTCALNGLASNDAGVKIGLYVNSTGDVSRAHPTGLTPSGWAFSIWGLIYFWQAAWLIYAITTLFRRGVDGYLYYSPDILPAYLYVFYIINNIANVCWLVVWSRELMIWALVMIIIATVTLYIASAGSYFGVTNNLELLTRTGLGRDVWLVRGLVQNGIGVYDTWLSIATLINVAVVFGEQTSLSMTTATTICLVILFLEILGWFLVDVLLLDRFTRYVIAPYFVYGFALIAIYDNNYDAGTTDGALYRNSILIVCCLALAWVLFAVKIAVTIWRHMKSKSQGEGEITPLRG